MKAAKVIFFFLLLLFTGASGVLAQGNTNPSSCIYYFYGEGCPHCANVSPFLDSLEEKYPNLNVERFEIYNDRENARLFQEYAQKYEVPQPWGVPAVFLEGAYFIGDTPVIENLEDHILSNPQSSCPSLEEQEEKTPAPSPTPGLGGLSLATIAGAAVVDSINPCAIAVLLILLSAFLMGAGSRRRALFAGLAFTASIYIAYFLFGLGLFSVIQFSGFSGLVYRAVGILAIIIGLLNIKDYFWYGGGGFVMEIPRSWRHILKDILYKVTSPLGAFLAGFVVILFELPCTGGPYFFVLGLLADKVSLSKAVLPLLFYNLVFVLPLVFITLLIYFGYSSIDNAAKWKEKNTRLLHLIGGLIMLALGVVVVLGLV